MTTPRPLRLAALAVLCALAVAAPAAATRAPARPLATGIVDIDTSLGYQSAAAAGTGIVVGSSGEVLTNNHVIRGATTIRVTDPATGRRWAATVVGYSVAGDVAVLQLQGASHLRTVRLGRSATVKVGQAVTALGNANGAGGPPAVAKGHVTGLGRTIVATDGDIAQRLVGLIQTDAPLQPGDSGGPLVNAAGRVVGIDTAASVGFAYQGSSEAYAIPIDTAVELARQIVAGQASATVHVGATPFLGVGVAASAQGLLVQNVVSGSPADQAGLAAGDTITGLDGTPVTTYEGLSSLLLAHTAGDTVTLTWLDQTGAQQSASVTTVAGPPQ